MNIIERSIHNFIDWLTAPTDQTFDDERGQYSFNPWNIFWGIVFLFLVLIVLRYFGLI